MLIKRKTEVYFRLHIYIYTKDPTLLVPLSATRLDLPKGGEATEMDVGGTGNQEVATMISFTIPKVFV
jgi:hypothetical protein